MSGETYLTIVGNLTGDPELRFTPSGKPVASFTVASTSTRFDRQSNAWKESGTIFLRCSAWGDLAENCAESLRKGMRVIVTGQLAQDSWEDRNTGERRSALTMRAQDVAASLRFARAKVERVERRPDQYQAGGQYAGEAYAAQQAFAGQRPDDEPPF